MQEVQRVLIKIPSLSEYVGVVRLAAAGIANRFKLTHEDIEDIKIAVSEACTNAVQYAYPGKTGEVEVTFNVHKEKLEIIVQDNGVGFDLASHTKGPRVEEDKGLGLGITFMQSLMDEVDYDTQPGKGTKVRMVKKASS